MVRLGDCRILVGRSVGWWVSHHLSLHVLDLLLLPLLLFLFDGKSYLANPTSLLSTGQTAEILVQNA